VPTRLARALSCAVLALSLVAGGARTATAGEDDDPVPDRSHAYSLTRAKQVVERRVIGTSVRGRDIVAFRKGNPDAKRTVLVIGQMHGDEPAGTVTAHWIRTRLPIDSDVDLWIVPTMNPDGLAAHSRRNARGVDLNRNWPTDGWVRTSRGSITYGGRRPASEPETRAMIAFLREVQPDWITSVHQPYGQVGRNGKTPLLVRRLARQLHLPIAHITVGTPDDHVAPTLASWYNATFDGGAVTVEYTAHPTRQFVTAVAGRGILAANLASW
jgi:murein tripeptide amidase MpaA